MAEIDPQQPIRLVKSKTRLHVVEFVGDDLLLSKDRNDLPRSSFRYTKEGEPVGAVPWGKVENFALLEDIADGDWEEVEPPKAKESSDPFIGEEDVDWMGNILPADMKKRLAAAMHKSKLNRISRDEKMRVEREERLKVAAEIAAKNQRKSFEDALGDNALWAAF